MNKGKGAVAFCAYCMGGADILYDDGDEVSIDTGRKVIEASTIVYSERGCLEFHINYCPMCGRKL